MFHTKTFKFGVTSVALSLALAACSSEPTDEGAVDEDTGDAGEGEGEGEVVETDDLIISNLSDIEAMDPHGVNDTPSSNVQTNIFESLVSQNEDMELQPLLAEDWEAVEEDVWEFTLRDDVTFHDGSEFNAEVVKANIERILDPDIASPRQFLYEMVEEVVVVDDYTVQFVTEYPFAPLPSHLSHTGGSMISLEVIEADYAKMEEEDAQPGEYINNNPIGTGFFEFEEWVSGEKVVLNNYEDYWGENAKVDSVTFQVTPEDQTRIGELETGSAHIIDPVSPSDHSRVNSGESTLVNEQDSLSLSYISFNTQKEPFDDPKVRKAISKAVDKDVIIDGLLEGFGTPAVAPIGPNVFGFSDEVTQLEYDVERAQELLAEAGYEDGFETTIWTNDSRDRQDIAEIVQAQLGEIGIDVSIEVLEWGAYLDNTAEGQHDMFILGWSTVTGDADYGLYALFHSSNHGAEGNRSFIDNEELDNLLDQGRREADPEAREEIYEEAMEILAEEAPFINIHHQTFLVGLREEVQGFGQHPDGLFELQDVTIEQ
ncbi:glutathione ABC transporter substrate-binding protein [Texcoconibacillus texcoconensis]|uniref:Peptide/nickel transport system substrate-binding protein n=1 Tax=Texcoconibacillus texcoconensis TaxID=1095777 RepID=A0A840QP86_9BACI|nr:glutathione ABC transporter substrate-binding protein [Texcoconibacillus texcoconensis]MBB5173137.1 peptide/nickel transport system substrate-binding protein [Texcoconibacillus texcoconensis]